MDSRMRKCRASSGDSVGTGVAEGIRGWEVWWPMNPGADKAWTGRAIHGAGQSFNLFPIYWLSPWSKGPCWVLWKMQEFKTWTLMFNLAREFKSHIPSFPGQPRLQCLFALNYPCILVRPWLLIGGSERKVAIKEGRADNHDARLTMRSVLWDALVKCPGVWRRTVPPGMEFGGSGICSLC